jgi:hypothetical protein
MRFPGEFSGRDVLEAQLQDRAYRFGICDGFVVGVVACTAIVVLFWWTLSR